MPDTDPSTHRSRSLPPAPVGADRTSGRVGATALAAGALALLLGPLHALARLRLHPDELTGPLVQAWAVPMDELLDPLLSFASPDVVYRSYGLVWFPALAAAASCAWTVRRLRAGSRGRVETLGWWIALPGLVLLALGAFVSYWLGLVDEGFVVLTLPGLLLGMIGQTVLGVALLAAGARPRLLGLLLTLVLPLVLVASFLGSQALGAVAVVVIWAVAGRALTS